MPKQWTVPGRMTVGVIVTVEAETADEAIERFDKMDWLDEIITDHIDWESTGRPAEDE